jgi:thiamine pyrophosphate-dependent acetolactate synthase large subunit-like protein
MLLMGFAHAAACTGPVLVDLPKDIQQQLAVPDWEEPMSITAYISRLPPPPEVRSGAERGLCAPGAAPQALAGSAAAAGRCRPLLGACSIGCMVTNLPQSRLLLLSDFSQFTRLQQPKA